MSIETSKTSETVSAAVTRKTGFAEGAAGGGVLHCVCVKHLKPFFYDRIFCCNPSLK